MTRIGVSLPAGGRSGPALEAQSLADAARRIEEAGCGFLLADPLTALSVAATVTRRVELGTGVLQVPLRNPVEPASGWAGPRWSRSGPRPRRPPVLIGSWAGSRWIERAAREFDGWVGSGARSSWRLLREGLTRFRDLGGRRAVLTNVVVRLDGRSSPDGPDDPCDLSGSPESVRDRRHRLRQLGFDDIVLVTQRHDAEYLRTLRAGPELRMMATRSRPEHTP